MIQHVTTKDQTPQNMAQVNKMESMKPGLEEEYTEGSDRKGAT